MGTIDALIELEELGVPYLFRKGGDLFASSCLCGKKNCRIRQKAKMHWERIKEIITDQALLEKLVPILERVPQQFLDRLTQLGVKMKRVHHGHQD